MKNQILTTSVWVEQEWTDHKLRWDPEEYGGVNKLHVPADQIWLPDLILYNNVDGNYELTIMTKATLHHDGRVICKPPAIYKSACEIDVEFFPFDQQTCTMKFGTWTYDGYLVDLKHNRQQGDKALIEYGMDLSEFYLSVEWDIMSVPAVRHEKYYSCCDTPYLDITFNITMRRKTLFYTVNLIFPCVLISGLSVLVFYLPSDSGEKISLSISVMLSLGVFFLLLAEIIPPTSLAVPLLGRYLIFTLILVTLSVSMTILVLNVNFRSPSTHKMSPWMRRVFLEVLPNFLCMQRPDQDTGSDIINLGNGNRGKVRRNSSSVTDKGPLVVTSQDRKYSCYSSYSEEEPAYPEVSCPQMLVGQAKTSIPSSTSQLDPQTNVLPTLPSYNVAVAEPLENILDRRRAEVDHSLLSLRFIAQHGINADSFNGIEEEWKYVALVLDRLFLWLFLITCVVGTAIIILQAPTLYDNTKPIDIILSKVGRRMRKIVD